MKNYSVGVLRKISHLSKAENNRSREVTGFSLDSVRISLRLLILIIMHADFQGKERNVFKRRIYDLSNNLSN